ncbi:MAG: hypothetical protein NUV91_09820 [Candidatus Omnitrophica bacterium]|nr:hypothetical protein [Candidatus Omnitrophota bacterium]
MIKIDFSIALAIALSLMLGTLFFLWIGEGRAKEEREGKRAEHLHQCPFCTYLFFDTPGEEVQHCPRCHSLLTRDDLKEKK